MIYLSLLFQLLKQWEMVLNLRNWGFASIVHKHQIKLVAFCSVVVLQLYKFGVATSDINKAVVSSTCKADFEHKH